MNMLRLHVKSGFFATNTSFRMISVTYGRSTMVHKSQALAAIDMCRKDQEDGLFTPSSAYLIRAVELFEIIHHAVLLLYDHSTGSGKFAKRVALPYSQDNKDTLETALQFDRCLSNWEQDLPLPLQNGAHITPDNEIHERQAIALRLR